jgi:hypothetical protein
MTSFPPFFISFLPSILRYKNVFYCTLFALYHLRSHHLHSNPRRVVNSRPPWYHGIHALLSAKDFPHFFTPQSFLMALRRKTKQKSHRRRQVQPESRGEHPVQGICLASYVQHFVNIITRHSKTRKLLFVCFICMPRYFRC